MTIHVHDLRGCAPTPLAHYLKALAVLRLVSEQRDPNARGWWKNEAFWLSTTLSREELSRFFLDEYAPTPILSPWNGGSGFYFREGRSADRDESGKLKKTGARDAPTAATRALDALLASAHPRLATYRECAAAAKAVVGRMKLREAPEGEEKAALAAALRSSLPDTRWIDASLSSTGIDKIQCAPLVGSGGNDGNEDFSKNFLERVLMLVDQQAATLPLLESTLFSQPCQAAADVAPGQFFPGGNAGVNAGPGFTGRPTSNPWEYVLALEGAVAFAGATARRLDAETAGASFPFAVRVDPAGYGSAGEADRKASRQELWLPLWRGASTLAEITALLGEGRVKLGRHEARRTTEVARGIASLGTSRGVGEFQRTAFFTRNGNMHYSVPAGRWRVASQPHEGLLDEIDPWLSRFRTLARDDRAPKAAASAGRVVDEAVLGVCQNASDPARWQALLIALGRAEAAIVASPASAADPKRGLAPLPPLRPAWLEAANDGSPELRLAAAFASQDVALSLRGATVWANVRAHWLPLDRSRGPRRALGERLPPRFAIGASGLSNDPDVVCLGQHLERDAIALVRRRIQVVPTTQAMGLGIIARAPAGLADVMAFLTGSVDDARVIALARPLMGIAWWEVTNEVPAAPRTDGVDAAYAVARLTHLSQPLDRGEPIMIGVDTEPVARLAAGDLAGAIALCLRRLRASRLSPVVSRVAGDARYARRLAASLAFPLRARDIDWCADLVTRPHELKETTHAD